VVEGLDWDLWLGSAAPRPFTVGGEGYPNDYGNFYQPFNWRGFYDFGCGALGDMACHILGAPNMALKLGSPTSVEAIKKEGTSDFMFPKKSIIRFDFPARGNMPPVKLFWYDGLEKTPELPGVPAGMNIWATFPTPIAAGGRGRRKRRGRSCGSAPRRPHRGRRTRDLSEASSITKLSRKFWRIPTREFPNPMAAFSLAIRESSPPAPTAPRPG
jgi:hypothetical protein